MPPEVLEGKIKKIGPSIDVWALGVILFGLVIFKFEIFHRSLDIYHSMVIICNR